MSIGFCWLGGIKESDQILLVGWDKRERSEDGAPDEISDGITEILQANLL